MWTFQSTSSPWRWLLRQLKCQKNRNNLGHTEKPVFFVALIDVNIDIPVSKYYMISWTHWLMDGQFLVSICYW